MHRVTKKLLLVNVNAIVSILLISACLRWTHYPLRSLSITTAAIGNHLFWSFSSIVLGQVCVGTAAFVLIEPRSYRRWIRAFLIVVTIMLFVSGIDFACSYSTWKNLNRYYRQLNLDYRFIAFSACSSVAILYLFIMRILWWPAHRLFNIRLEFRHVKPTEPTEAETRRSLGGIFCWTAAIALVLGLLTNAKLLPFASHVFNSTNGSILLTVFTVLIPTAAVAGSIAIQLKRATIAMAFSIILMFLWVRFVLSVAALPISETFVIVFVVCCEATVFVNFRSLRRLGLRVQRH